MQLDSPKFNVARRFAWGLLGFGVFLLAAGTALLLSNRIHWPLISRPPLAIARALGFFGAALLVASSGLVSAAVMSFARRALAGRTVRDIEPVVDAPAGRFRRMFWRAQRGVGRLRLTPEAAAGWLQSAMAALVAAWGCAGIILFWRTTAAPGAMPPALQILAGSLVLATFPLLVVERFYTTTPEDLLPESDQISRLLRVPITAAIWLAATLALRAFGFAWASKLEPVLGVLIFAIGLEVFVRCVAMLFLPYAVLAERRATAESKIASALLRLAMPSLKKINTAVRSQLGIDLSRSWALSFIQKAAVPGFIGLAIFSWLTTGVSTLPGNQRGIYERLGTPVTVFGPGLHVHLPWPLGMIRPVETGVVHKLPIEFLLPNAANTAAAPGASAPAEDLVGAEAPPPDSANRLWTTGHPDEGSYIIAGQDSFQLVDVDMNVVYRIGTSEAEAKDAVYSVASAQDLIEALSGQLLVHYFAANTLTDVLGQSREKFADDFRTKLQQQLDQAHSGIDAIAVLVEAVHPPPGAAAAYHSVQAAQILAQTQVATSRGDAARAVKGAQTSAIREHDQAESTAADLLSQAKVDSALFKAESDAYSKAGYPVIFERWLDQVSRSLRRSPNIIIDHRLSKQDTPTIDLRPTNGGAGAATVPAAERPRED